MIEAATIFTALKAIGEIAKSFVGIRDAAMIGAKTSELMSKILEVQTFAFEEQLVKKSLSEQIGALEKEILNFKNWEAEKTKYYLRSIGLGAVVYALKDEPMNEGEPFHQICAHCYEKQCKSILQFESVNNAIDCRPHVYYNLVCNNCKSKIQIHTLRNEVEFKYLKPSKAYC